MMSSLTVPISCAVLMLFLLMIHLSTSQTVEDWCAAVRSGRRIPRLSGKNILLRDECTFEGKWLKVTKYKFTKSDYRKANRLGTLIDEGYTACSKRYNRDTISDKSVKCFRGISLWWNFHPFFLMHCNSCLDVSIHDKTIVDTLNYLCSGSRIAESVYFFLGFELKDSAGLRSEVQKVCTDDINIAANNPMFCILKPLFDIGLFRKAYLQGKFLDDKKKEFRNNMKLALQPSCMLIKPDVRTINRWNTNSIQIFIQLFSSKPTPDTILTGSASLVLENIQARNFNFFKTYIPQDKVDEYIANICTDSKAQKTTNVCLFMKLLQQANLYKQIHELDSNLTSISADGKRRLILNKEVDENYFQNQQLSSILKAISNTKATIIKIADDIKKHASTKFSQLRTYFENIESFNNKISKADIGFITSRLALYKESLTYVYKTMKHDFGKLLHLTLKGAGVKTAERAALFAMEVISAANPLSFLTGGTSVADIYDRANDLAAAVADLVQVKSIQSALNRVKTSTMDMVTRLKNNQDFLESVQRLTETGIQQDGTLFEKAKNEFIKQYNNYNPQVTRPEIEGLGAYWVALLDATCDVVANLDTAGSAGVGSKINDAGWCQSLPAVLARMNGLHEEIYEFQFDMMDAMTSYVQSQVTLNAANTIKNKFTEIQVDYSREAEIQLIGVLMFLTDKTNRLQAIHLYCNGLEYESGGLRPSACHGAETNLVTLLAKNKPSCVGNTLNLGHFVPSKSSNAEGLNNINLKDLFEEKKITFKIPDAQWLVDNRWIGKDEKSRSFYVRKFQIYLPVETTASFRFRSIAEASPSQQLIPGSSTVYVMTTPQVMEFEYKTGIPNTLNCLRRVFKNPYSSGCSRSKICPLSRIESKGETNNYSPSVYSTWTLSVIGGKDLPVPEPTTRFDLILGMELCKMESNHPIPQGDVDNVRPRQYGNCCPSDKYRGFGSSGCLSCPADSKPDLGGYFCKKTG